MNKAVKILGIILALVILLVIFTPTRSDVRSNKIAEACYSMQNLLETVIEEHNQKHPENQIKEFEGKKTIDLLNKEGYLKGPLVCHKIIRDRLGSSFLEYWYSLFSPRTKIMKDQYRHESFASETGKINVICIEHGDQPKK